MQFSYARKPQNDALFPVTSQLHSSTLTHQLSAVYHSSTARVGSLFITSVALICYCPFSRQQYLLVTIKYTLPCHRKHVGSNSPACHES